MERNWTAEEVEILLNHYRNTTVSDLKEKHYPNRTLAAIRGKAVRLGVKRDTSSILEPKTVAEATSDRELLEELSSRGFIIRKGDLPPVDQTYRMPKLLEPIEIGVVSDPHLGSNYQQLTHLHDFYDFCADRGIKTILNAGDICAGNGNVYRGQIYEMFIHGADATVDYVVKNYPHRRGIKTMAIAGNHDESFLKNDGTDIVSRVAEKRTDFDYLGMHGAYVKLGNIKIYLMHPSGGVAYARSYKVQKIVEQFSPQNKPHILFCGHYHITNHLPMYRNVEAFNVGCFEAQTPYLKRKGLYPSIGGLIVKIYPTEEGLDGISTRWKFYYEPIEDDY